MCHNSKNINQPIQRLKNKISNLNNTKTPDGEKEKKKELFFRIFKVRNALTEFWVT